MNDPGYAPINPIHEYMDLFKDVQLNAVFDDQKKFVDCRPRYSPAVIRKKYAEEKKRRDFDIKAFVDQNFNTLFMETSDVLDHINYLWSYLTKKSDQPYLYSTYLPLPKPYIIPGGRFREIYYWDSFFTMLGLQENGNYEMIENMLDNFSYLIDVYGFIPNGNRTYYLSRSQPPFFSSMIQLLAEKEASHTYKKHIYLKYASGLENEYRYWMKGKSYIKKDFATHRHCVRLPGQNFMNRYWDQLNTPRPEAYKYDMDLYRKSKKKGAVFREIRSAVESGWDFSSRWLDQKSRMEQICATGILPVDLNCLLYHMETTLQYIFELDSLPTKARHYQGMAEKRKKLILEYFWDESQGYFFDYHFKDQRQTPCFSLAGLFPLYFNIAEPGQAERVAGIIGERFLKTGGLVTTLSEDSTQQWDHPNGWAPLQWIGFQACMNYGFHQLARQIAERWTHLNSRIFFETGKMMEKYNVVDTSKYAGGGEYELQDGFGWTNGVFLKLWNALNR